MPANPSVAVLVKNSNTTLVKVKFPFTYIKRGDGANSNTTLVKVKFNEAIEKFNKTKAFKYNTC